MLVLEPSKRFTLAQIKAHRWTQMGYVANNSIQSPIVGTSAINERLGSRSPPPNSIEAMDQILKLIQSLGIDSNKTREVCNRLMHLYLVGTNIMLSLL